MKSALLLKYALILAGIASAFVIVLTSPKNIEARRTIEVYSPPVSHTSTYINALPPDNELINVAVPSAANLASAVDNNIEISDAAEPGIPVRIKIPKIQVNARIVPVGSNAAGGMVAPNGPRNVGWLKSGPRPGEIGSAVLAGHYGRWRSGEGSVFDRLKTLKNGDQIYIEDGNGGTIAFVVRELRRYDKNAKAERVFSSNDGKAHLSIITCDGVWNPQLKTFSHRLVVFADSA